VVKSRETLKFWGH